MKKKITNTIFTIVCFLFLGISGSFAAADINSIRATIYSWQEAWQSKDINRYKLFYSKKFKSDGFDYQRWMNKKEKIFAAPGAISIELFDMEINPQNEQIIVTFIQRYKSGALSDVGEKKIILIQSDDMYKIIAEKFVPLRDPTLSDEENLFGTQPLSVESKRVKPAVPKYPASPAPVVKRTGSKSTINLNKLMHTPSLFKEMQVITQKGGWQQVRYADAREGWINTEMIDRDVSPPQKKQSYFTPKTPDPKVEQTKQIGIKPVDGPLISGTGQTVISITSLEWLYLAPTSDSKKTERLTEGKAYLVVRKKGAWVGLKLDQDRIGWTHQKYMRPDTSDTLLSPETMSASAKLPKPPIPETTPAPAPAPVSKPSKPSVLSRPQEKKAKTATRTVKLVTPKVSFARAYEKPTIDSMILFRLKQDKRYVLIERHGDWFHIEDDNGMTGWGHRTLFMKKIETADITVAIDRQETKKSIPAVSGSDLNDSPLAHAPESKPALSPDVSPPSDVPVSDATAPPQPAASTSEQALPEEPRTSAGELSPPAKKPDKEPETTDLPQDEPPLFVENEEPVIDIDSEDEQKETKPVESEPSSELSSESSSDENASQLTIKNSNQLTPTVSLVRVYANPSTDGRIMFWLTKGKTYTFTDKKDGWYHIQLADGREGWAHLPLYMNNSLAGKNDQKKKSEAVSINQKLTSVVILGGAHEKPSLDSKVKFRLEKGVTYPAEKKQGSWYLIKNDNGDTGWAHKSLFDAETPKQKQIDDTKNIKRVNNIRFEATPAGEEKILFTLNGFYPPKVFLMEESKSTLVCDFSDIQSSENLKPLIDINQKFVKRIRTEMYKESLRVSVDLTPGKSYDVRQVFFKKENLFTLIFSTNEN
ncbi:SH3 domain-containing protein [Desulfococcaceae bacterium HSG9]|nr:SH3 domain-containing protein [Desulfococcaceae bacterium HSG9]